MPQSFACLNFHIIFSTKHREPFIAQEWEDALFGAIGGTLHTVRGRLLAAGGVADHVHLLVSLPRDLSVADCVRNVKTVSSKWVHENVSNMVGFAWQVGYAAFSASFSHLEQIRGYLSIQELKHQGMTYQDEVRAFLRAHDIEPDEAHMWD